MLWDLQLRKSQKAILAGLFSVGLVVAVFDILRTVESLQAGTFSGVALWSSLEVTIAVIVESLPLYRVLLTRKGRQYLISRGSMGRYKDIGGGGQASVERKLSEDRSSQPGKPSVHTFRDELETGNLPSPKQVQHIPLTHL